MQNTRTIRFTCDDGNEYTISQFAKKHDKTHSQVMHRWLKMGRPTQNVKVSELARISKVGNQAHIKIILVDNRKGKNFAESIVSITEVAAICNEILREKKPVTSYSARWNAWGRPDRVMLSRFIKWARGCKLPGRITVLAEIPTGDLANLSRKEKSVRFVKKVVGKPGTWEKENLDPDGFAPSRDSFSGNYSNGMPVYTGKF